MGGMSPPPYGKHTILNKVPVEDADLKVRLWKTVSFDWFFTNIQSDISCRWPLTMLKVTKQTTQCRFTSSVPAVNQVVTLEVLQI